MVRGENSSVALLTTASVKLAFVTETFPPEINGVAMTFGVISLELGRRGHEITIHRPRRNDLPPAAARIPPQFRVAGFPEYRPGYPLRLLRTGDDI